MVSVRGSMGLARLGRILSMRVPRYDRTPGFPVGARVRGGFCTGRGVAAAAGVGQRTNRGTVARAALYDFP